MTTNTTLHIKIEPERLQEIDLAARRMGQSRSGFVRSAALSQARKTMPPLLIPSEAGSPSLLEDRHQSTKENS